LSSNALTNYLSFGKLGITLLVTISINQLIPLAVVKSKAISNPPGILIGILNDG
jgi:hypothetical protein